MIEALSRMVHLRARLGFNRWLAFLAASRRAERVAARRRSARFRNARGSHHLRQSARDLLEAVDGAAGDARDLHLQLRGLLRPVGAAHRVLEPLQGRAHGAELEGGVLAADIFGVSGVMNAILLEG